MLLKCDSKSNPMGSVELRLIEMSSSLGRFLKFTTLKSCPLNSLLVFIFCFPFLLCPWCQDHSFTPSIFRSFRSRLTRVKVKTKREFKVKEKEADVRVGIDGELRGWGTGVTIKRKQKGFECPGWGWGENEFLWVRMTDIGNDRRWRHWIAKVPMRIRVYTNHVSSNLVKGLAVWFAILVSSRVCHHVKRQQPFPCAAVISRLDKFSLK